MNMLRDLLLSLFLACALCAPAFGDVAPGEIKLQTAASTQVETDLMVVRMAADVEDTDPAKLAQTVNDAIAWALKQAKSHPDVTVRGGAYSTYPVYKKQTISHWRGVQQLILESGDPVQLGELVGKLQEKLLIQGVDYRLSQDRRANTENELIERALTLFKQRAALVQTNLGAQSYRLHTLNIRTEPQEIQPRLMQGVAAVSAEQGKPAQLTPGYKHLKVLVSGSIILSPSGPPK